MPEDAPAASGAVTGPDGAALLGRLTAIEARLAELNQRAAHREAVIDRLHQERDELRRGERRVVLEPVIADLIRLHDALTLEATRAASEPGLEGAADLLRSFAGDVELMLDRCGIETMHGEPGEAHRPGDHRATGVVPVDVPEWHNTLAEVVALGFRERHTGRVRRPLLGRFHRYEDPGRARPGATDIETAGETPAAG